ncbi:MAG: 30S ribosomal protein S1 [Candidatus Anammoxibacter sp.]
MVKVDILKEFDIDRDEIDKEVNEVILNSTPENIEDIYTSSLKNYEVGAIIKGTVLNIADNGVIIDGGYKSEGVVNVNEFDTISEVKIGDEVEVLLETIEDDTGLIKLSKRKADRIKGWQKVITKHKEGDVVTGKVLRKIRGGLIVDLGVPIFLPASQIDIKPPGEIAEYIGKDVTCKILKIDNERQNIVVSRRKLIEEERLEKRQSILAEIQEGEVRKGIVKNIADFGVFVDLGGLDGLLHITDMSWGRVSHPSEMLAIGDEVEVKVMDVNKEQGRISLGLKQKTENPWLNVDEKYPVSSNVKGEVVNIMNYGAFVKLETGVEGLIHISEMSWTRRINHPTEVVAIGDIVEVVVLKVDKDNTEISLSMKQTEVNPWAIIEEKYPKDSIISGRVRNLTNYGAFIEIEEGVDGLLHISDMSWSKKVNHPSEIVKKGDKIETIVLSVDKEKKRVALGLKQLSVDPWEKEIPDKYKLDDVIKGKVSKLTNFGAFIDIGDGLEGLLHISELSKNKRIGNPADVVSIGDEIETRIIRIEPESRKIGLGLKDPEIGIVKKSENGAKTTTVDENAEDTAEDTEAESGNENDLQPNVSETDSETEG